MGWLPPPEAWEGGFLARYAIAGSQPPGWPDERFESACLRYLGAEPDCVLSEVNWRAILSSAVPDGLGRRPRPGPPPLPSIREVSATLEAAGIRTDRPGCGRLGALGRAAGGLLLETAAVRLRSRQPASARLWADYDALAGYYPIHEWHCSSPEAFGRVLATYLSVSILEGWPNRLWSVVYNLYELLYGGGEFRVVDAPDSSP